MWQIEDTHVDSGNRVYELNGFSGSPVWSLEADEKNNCRFVYEWSWKEYL